MELSEEPNHFLLLPAGPVRETTATAANKENSSPQYQVLDLSTRGVQPVVYDSLTQTSH